MFELGCELGKTPCIKRVKGEKLRHVNPGRVGSSACWLSMNMSTLEQVDKFSQQNPCRKVNKCPIFRYSTILDVEGVNTVIQQSKFFIHVWTWCPFCTTTCFPVTVLVMNSFAHKLPYSKGDTFSKPPCLPMKKVA